MDSDSFWRKYGTRTLIFVVGAGVSILLLITAVRSSATFVKNTDVAIVVNNVTGGVSRLENGGMVFHLPFGLSSVYTVDKSQRVLYLTRVPHDKKHPPNQQVNIKTNDGSNVIVEVEVVYKVDHTRAEQAYRELGKEENIEEILMALTRSEIRSQFGELSTQEIAEATDRTKKIDATQIRLRDRLKPLGIEVETVTVKNFQFDAEYDRIIRDRKEADQILTNQHDYRAAATEEGKRMIAEAERDKQTALAALQGDLKKQLLTAQGDAQRIVTKAEQNAYKLEREGEVAVKTAEQEADALRSEGLRKAEAMEQLFAAYEHGGEGLVKEALVRMYEGVRIRARPYALSDRVEQIQANRAVPLQQSDSTQGGQP